MSKTIKPENIRIRVISATKRRTKDNYEHGCEIESLSEKEIEHASSYPSIEEAFSDIVGAKVKAKEVTTLDPNIYCDLKAGGTRVVKDNTTEGNYRCNYNRMENWHGRPPTKAENSAFVKGETDLVLADYDVSFRIEIVGLEEKDTAELLGVILH